MKKYLGRCLLTVSCAFAIMIVFAENSHAQLVATWTGGGDGVNYSDPANWSTGVVPINGATNYNVVVPNGRNIVFDVAGSISGISYGTGGSITVADGVAFNVNSVASLNSNIIADGAGTSFTANGVGVVLGNNVRTVATNGAFVATSAINYTSNATVTAFHATGSSSTIQGRGMSTITNAGGVSTFLAENEGTIDFSNVQAIVGSGNTFTIRTGGMIDFENLRSAAGRFNIEIARFDLPSATTASGMALVLSEGTVFNTPQLIQQTGGAVQIPDRAIWNAGALETLDGTDLNISVGGTFNAPELANFRNSSVTIDQGVGFNVGPLTNVDNSRIAVAGGTHLSVGAGNFTRSLGSSNTAFSADGAGSEISALSMNAINNTAPLGGLLGQQFTTTFRAENNGILDFSSVQSIDGGFAGSDGRSTRNLFSLRTGGKINLDSVQTISQLNTFDIEVPQFNLPSLQTSSGLTVNLSVGTVFNTPQLTTQNGTSVSIPIFSTWNADALTTLDGTSLNIDVGGTLNSPNLINFRNSSLTLEPGVGFNAGSLTSVDNSRITVLGGSQLAIAATDFTRSVGGSNTAFRADGNGSRISAALMASIRNTSPLGGLLGQQFTTNFIAENGGVLEFSNAQLIEGGFFGSSGRSTRNMFTAKAGGSIEFGNVLVTRYNTFSVEDPNSILSFKSLELGADNRSTFLAINLGRVEVSGSLSHQHVNEANFNFDNGRIVFKDTPLASLEIAGENKGTATNGLGNFGFQQLTVGSLSSATTLVFSDNVNNGNRVNGSSEVQYLLDVSGNGLVLNSGSGIILNGHDLFVSNGQDSFFSVRDLFAAGQTAIAYDSGFIALTAMPGEIINGSFEFGGDDSNLRLGPGFNFIGPGLARMPQVPRTGNLENHALELTAGSPVTVSQYVSLLDDPFYIQFEAWSQDESGTLSLLLDDVVMQEWDWSELGTSEFQWMSFLVNDPALLGSIDINLALRWDGNTGDQILIDNLRIVAVPEPSSVLVLAGLSVVVLRRCRRRPTAKH